MFNIAVDCDFELSSPTKFLAKLFRKCTVALQENSILDRFFGRHKKFPTKNILPDGLPLGEKQNRWQLCDVVDTMPAHQGVTVGGMKEWRSVMLP
jgi:hypothetical protein